MVKVGMIAGAGNVVIFNSICSWRARKVAFTAAGGLRFAFSGSERSRIMLGSFSDRSRIGNDQISVRCWVVILRGRRSIW